MLLRKRQQVFVQRCLAALDEHGNTLGIGPTGCHAPGTLILLFDGSTKPVEEITTQDLLMGPDSAPRRVLELHRGYDFMHEIRPIKGQPFRVNRGHILTLVRTNEGDWKRGINRHGELVDISVADYLQASAGFRHRHKLVRLPADFSDPGAVEIDPYFLGVLIGDGCIKHSVSVTTPDVEIVETLYHQANAWGLSVRVDQLPDNQANTYHLVITENGANPLKGALRKCGLLGTGAGEKFIPREYLLGSRETRLSILAGLLDTDGHLGSHGTFEFSSRSETLVQHLAFIARSLGFLASSSRKEVHGVLYWRVHVSGDLDRIPTRVLRKQAKPRKQKKNVLRTGFTVHEVGWGEYFGFTVDGDQRYLMGDFTLTHNSGKTVMLSAVTGAALSEPDAKACILAHRDELTFQNRSKFGRVNPNLTTSVFDAKEKSWGGQATFAMVQTLSNPRHLDAMPALDLLIIDEAHHAASFSYRRIIDAVRSRNTKAQVFGVTATPNRGDGVGLREVFSNVGDQITLGELIASGHLVRPRTFVIDLGKQEELQGVRKTAADFDMSEVAAILNTPALNQAVVRHWLEKALDRKTLVFCSTVAHAEAVCEAFREAGVSAVLIHGELSDQERKSRLREYEQGTAQVVVNVAVLTEGYDYTPTSCIVLLRPSSHASTFIQMVGRGLRVVDPSEHPHVVKTDCLILDFGTASLQHGTLEQAVNLDGREHTGEAPTQDCPECGALIPLACRECPLCGASLWERNEAGETAPLTDFVLSEIDLLNKSNFLWCDLFGDDASLMATGFSAWAGVFLYEGRWHAVGGINGREARSLAVGERAVCLAQADDFLNGEESAESAHKTRRWLREPATPKQLQYLPPELRSDFGMTRYRASALLSFRFNRPAIRKAVGL